MIKKMNFRISAATWTAKFFLSTFLIFYLVQKTNAHDIKELFFGANNKYFFIIFFLVLSQVILAVIRWKSLLAFIANKNIFFFSLLKNYLSSLFIGNFLPGALGFDFFRYLFIKKQGVPFDKNLRLKKFLKLLRIKENFFKKEEILLGNKKKKDFIKKNEKKHEAPKRTK